MKQTSRHTFIQCTDQALVALVIMLHTSAVLAFLFRCVCTLSLIEVDNIGRLDVFTTDCVSFSK